MKLKISVLASAALAQFDYNPNAEYDEYNPETENTIARGVRFERPKGDINQFAISSALADQLGALANTENDIDFDALAQILLQRQTGTTTTEAPTTVKPTTAKKTKTVDLTRNNDSRFQPKRAKQPKSKTKKTTTTKKPSTFTTKKSEYNGPAQRGFRGEQKIDSSDTRGHTTFGEQQKIQFRSAALQFAEKLHAYRTANRNQVFSESGSGEGESNSLLRSSMGDNNFGFYDYYDGSNFDAFYDYAEQLIEEGAVGKGIDWNVELGKLNEQVGENRAPIQCWTCQRTYWDANSTGDLWADCRTHGRLVTCPQHLEDTGSSHYSTPMSCQITEHKFFGVTSELEVGCKQTRACQNNFEQNRMAGSIYGRTCRVESSFGTSKCRQCCSTDSCFDGTTSTMDQSAFDQESEWFDTANHATYNIV